LRAHFIELSSQLSNGTYLFIAKPKLLECSYKIRDNSLKSALKKLNALQIKFEGNQLDKLDIQKRFLIATVLSLLAFIAYDYFYISKQQYAQLEQKTATEQNKQYEAPQFADAAPAQSVTDAKTTATTAPETSTSLDRTLVVVKAPNFTLELDRLGRISQVTLQENNL